MPLPSPNESNPPESDKIERPLSTEATPEISTAAETGEITAVYGKAEQDVVQAEAEISGRRAYAESYAREAGEEVPPETAEAFEEVQEQPRRLFGRFLAALGIGKKRAARLGPEAEPAWTEAEPKAGELPPPTLDGLAAFEAELAEEEATRSFLEAAPGEIESRDFETAEAAEATLNWNMTEIQVVALSADLRDKLIAALIEQKDTGRLEQLKDALMTLYEVALRNRALEAQTEDEARWAKKARRGRSVPKGGPSDLDLLLGDIKRVGLAINILETNQKPVAGGLAPEEAKKSEPEITAAALTEEIIELTKIKTPAPSKRFPKDIELEAEGRFPAVIMLAEEAWLAAEPLSLAEREQEAVKPAEPVVDKPLPILEPLRQKTAERVNSRLAELKQLRTDPQAMERAGIGLRQIEAEAAMLLDQERLLNSGLLPLDVARDRLQTLKKQVQRLDRIIAEKGAALKKDQSDTLQRRKLRHQAKIIALQVYIAEPYARALGELKAKPAPERQPKEKEKETVAEEAGAAARPPREKTRAETPTAISETETPTQPNLRRPAIEAQMADINKRLKDEAFTLSADESLKLIKRIYELQAELYADSEIILTPAEEAAKPTAELPAAETEYPAATVKHIQDQARLIFLMDIDRGLTPEEQAELKVLIETDKSDQFWMRYRERMTANERASIFSAISDKVSEMKQKEAPQAAAEPRSTEREGAEFRTARQRHIEESALQMVLYGKDLSGVQLTTTERATLSRLRARPPFVQKYSRFLTGERDRIMLSEAIYARAQQRRLEESRKKRKQTPASDQAAE